MVLRDDCRHILLDLLLVLVPREIILLELLQERVGVVSRRALKVLVLDVKNLQVNAETLAKKTDIDKVYKDLDLLSIGRKHFTGTE